MRARYFLVNTGRLGGEVCVGSVSQAFYDYWKQRDEDDLIDAVFNDGADCEDSPTPTGEDYWTPWNEIDDYYHGNGPYADNSYTVTEITPANGVRIDKDGDLVDVSGQVRHRHELYTEVGNSQKDFDLYHGIHSAEVYAREFDNGAPAEGYEPVLVFHSIEKGNFGEVIIQTDDSGFDHRKFRVDTVETDVGEFVHSYWYDENKLDICYDDADSVGKGTSCHLGYMSRAEHDEWGQHVTQENIQEFWDVDEEFE